LHELPIKALRGIGHVLEEKLMRRHIRTCGQLCRISKVIFCSVSVRIGYVLVCGCFRAKSIGYGLVRFAGLRWS